MAGALKKTMIYLGLADGDEQYEEEQRAAEQPRRQERAERHAAAEPAEQAGEWEDETRDERPQPVHGSHASHPQPAEREYRAPVTPIKRATQSREEATAVRQITTVHPRSYNDAKLIGESFRGGIPVIMNVTDMSESDAKRLVDFSAGLVFGLHGAIERVTNKVFLLTPATVQVLGEDTSGAEDQAHFFNQS
ncbi:cell division protein SepF [Citricoccus nitrophenolicus]|uniref:Cell division protein SepF n=1 Tax=Citricoccus nitrophenolicus TaxID=863575 RepID=A0ABV0IL47_9MICC|nr:cell division protein SepF [Citricoccus sp. I39-566]WMY77612.1 cell division protein SepF [Citricoccus sp. I39-566]